MKRELSLKLTGYDELLSLHRGLIEAKFHLDPESVDVPESPLLARVSERVVEALIAAERDRGRPADAERWERWRDRPAAGRFWSIAVSHATRSTRWTSMSQEERREFARDLLAPFRADDDALGRFLAEVEERRMAQTPP